MFLYLLVVLYDLSLIYLQYSSEEEEEDLETTLANSLKNKKKEMFVVDHEKVYYRPFKKNFYVEVPQIANMSAEGLLLCYCELLMWSAG